MTKHNFIKGKSFHQDNGKFDKQYGESTPQRNFLNSKVSLTSLIIRVNKNIWTQVSLNHSECSIEPTTFIKSTSDDEL